MEVVPASWLEAQMSLEAIEVKLGRHAGHPVWWKLKEQAPAGDEFSSFSSPSPTWPAKLGAAGYALRNGVVVGSFTILWS